MIYWWIMHNFRIKNVYWCVNPMWVFLYKSLNGSVYRLVIQETIGEGAFGIVKKAIAYGIGRVPKATQVAVKSLRGKFQPFIFASIF